MWQPNKEERKYLELVLNMTLDCLLGKGTDTKKTYLENLNRITGFIALHWESDNK